GNSVGRGVGGSSVGRGVGFGEGRRAAGAGVASTGAAPGAGVGVTRCATITLGPVQEIAGHARSDAARTAIALLRSWRPARCVLTYPGSGAPLPAPGPRGSHGEASDTSSRPAGTDLRSVTLPDGHRTVTISALL